MIYIIKNEQFYEINIKKIIIKKTLNEFLFCMRIKIPYYFEMIISLRNYYKSSHSFL
jgi:hypothetical protein